jgi:hypothetical protein
VLPLVSLFRQKHTLPFWLAVLFLFSLFPHDNVSACQCSGPGPTPCQAIVPHSAVFIGRVDSIETPSFFAFLKSVSLRSSIPFREQYWAFSNNVTVVFTVEECFRGQPQKIGRLHITKFLGSCGYEYRPGDFFFHKGERYLDYAGENNGILSTNRCSKTRVAHEKDDAEIQSLRRLHRLPSSVVTGTYVVPYIYGPNAPVVGANVTLTSPVGQRFMAKTDTDGGFTVSELPPATQLTKFNSTLRLATS